jgi:tetratricopeptide (TPR) repeat protein
MLETIRQFAEEQLATIADVDEVRDRHARYFAAQAETYWDLWDGPSQRAALDWVDVELGNLRSGFRWAVGHHKLETAAAVAAHTVMLAFQLQVFEPVAWAEEILDAATTDDVRQLPRVYTAACLCSFLGRPHAAIAYAQRAQGLEVDPRYDGFQPGWTRFCEAVGEVHAGRIDRTLEIAADLSSLAEPEIARLFGLGTLMVELPAAGRTREARTIAEETLAAARAYGNPTVIAFVLLGYGRAYADTDPPRALRAFREGLIYSREHRLAMEEGQLLYSAARLEAVYGDLDEALESLDVAIDAFHRAGNRSLLALALAYLAVLFDRVRQPDIAVSVYGASAGYPGVSVAAVPGLPDTVEHLRDTLGPAVFDACLAAGQAMELGEAVAYARRQIRLARRRPDGAP